MLTQFAIAHKEGKAKGEPASELPERGILFFVEEAILAAAAESLANLEEPVMTWRGRFFFFGMVIFSSSSVRPADGGEHG